MEKALSIEKYEQNKKVDKDHVATPRYVVEDIYDLIDIESFKMIWFPFNHYDSEFKLKGDELKCMGIGYALGEVCDSIIEEIGA